MSKKSETNHKWKVTPLIVLLLLVAVSFCKIPLKSAKAEEGGNYPFQEQLEQDFNKVTYYGDTEIIKNLEIEDKNREPVLLKQDENKLTLINYWASWCVYCNLEFPVLEELSKNHEKDIKIIYIGDTKEGYKSFESMAIKSNLPQHDNFYDSRNFVKKRYEISTLPTTFIVSPEGKIIYRLEGNGDWNSSYMEKLLGSLINNSSTPPES